MEPSPECRNVEYPQGREQQAANPFPSPSRRQDDQEDAGWYEMNEQGKGRLPEALVFTEYVQRE